MVRFPGQWGKGPDCPYQRIHIRADINNCCYCLSCLLLNVIMLDEFLREKYISIFPSSWIQFVACCDNSYHVIWAALFAHFCVYVFVFQTELTFGHGLDSSLQFSYQDLEMFCYCLLPRSWERVTWSDSKSPKSTSRFQVQSRSRPSY